MVNKMKKRESNYELMRIIAMLMIVMGHFWGQSGYDEMATGISYIVGQFLGCGSRVAVNLFLFLGIWFMVESQIRAKRLLNLYFNVATITIPISLLVYIWGGTRGRTTWIVPYIRESSLVCSDIFSSYSGFSMVKYSY